jgi:CHAT domain-containing protein/Flp pilus assembly protein TadD
MYSLSRSEAYFSVPACVTTAPGHRRARVAALVLLAFAAGHAMPARAAADPQLIQPGDTVVRLLAGSQPHRYRLELPGAYRVAAEAIERGVILEVKAASGERLQRTGSWRGAEGAHAAIVSTIGPTVVVVHPDDEIGPPGRYRLTVAPFDETSPDYEAGLAMARGADLHLRHYFGESDERIAAREQFLKAARLFTRTGNRQGQADAIYEAAYVSNSLREHQLAVSQYAQAEDLFAALGDERGVAKCLNERGLLLWRLGETEAAISALEQAIARREAFGPAFFLAQALNNLGLVYRDRGDAMLALRFFDSALNEWQRDTDLLQVDPVVTNFASLQNPPYLGDAITAMTNLGWAYDSVADTDQARRVYTQALALAQRLNRNAVAAKLQNNLGTLAYSLGDLDGALDFFRNALKYFSGPARDEFWAAKVHHNLAFVHVAAGDLARARDEANTALGYRTPDRDPVGRLESLRLLAEIDLQDGLPARASRLLQDARRLLETVPVPPESRGAVLALAGEAALADSHPEDAWRHFDAALAEYRLAGDRRGEARARAKRAAAGLQMGRFVSAELEIEQALELARAIEDRLGELDMLTEIAEAYARAGRFEAAHHYASEAAGDGEALRQTLVHPALLSQFAAVQRRAYEVLVHALVQLGHTDEAWTAANRARARRFAELVQRSHADYRLFTEEETRRLETLRTQVATKASRRSDLLARRARDEAERVRRQLTPLLEELQALEQRRDTGVLAAAEAPTLEEFQAVVDDGSIVLDYFVGAMGSGVWAITHDGASFHPLPPQNELEASVLRTARALRGPTAPRPADVTELSRLLLAPAAAQLRAADRLVVIPDGALQYLPFVVLAPDDARDASPRQRSDTVGSEETIDADSPVHLPAAISYLPSAEALLALRENNPRNGSGIAVVADPIFSTDDQRVLPSWLASRGEQGKASRATGRDALAAVPRLPGTAVEAEAIRRAAGSATKVRTLLGGDANRSAVLEGGVEDVGVVHFATHGVLDLQEPSLSGLALSVVSANGVPELSVLRALDVMRLPLSADLVVLSGCDTAIGKDVRGEGMLSLSRAFFYAGARQVVSSLWRVPDEATALLMERFLRGATAARRQNPPKRYAGRSAW